MIQITNDKYFNLNTIFHLLTIKNNQNNNFNKIK